MGRGYVPHVGGGAPQWRCYAKHTLSSDLARYERGDTYCTRQQLLVNELVACKSGQRPSGGSVERAAPIDAALQRRPPFVPKVEAPPPGCDDALTECAIWAQYDECRQNP